ncbi:MAG: hypothetical protein GXY44_14965 [Phycisphaerales bacterium]|nr:hypothetical protein [Phycisphaerales bacterium]
MRAAAQRLMECVLDRFPRAGNHVTGDALYADTEWFKSALFRGRHTLAVLKDNRHHLGKDARRRFHALASGL